MAKDNADMFAIMSLIFGILGLIIFAIIFGPLAIIFGAIGMKSVAKKSLAIIGLILGIIE